MKLTIEGIKEKEAWEKAGIRLPVYDVAGIAEKTRKDPVWVHFGIGNIFRIFMGDIADRLIRAGEIGHGITCVETFDYEVVDKVYAPHDNLALCVTLLNDGTNVQKVIGSLSESLAVRPDDRAAMNRLKEIFVSESLQMASFTITEKGYALRDASGNLFDAVSEDLRKGPAKPHHAMTLLTSMLWERYSENRGKIALVSMDNVSRNGEKLRDTVIEIASEWERNGFVDEEFIDYVSDESQVAFPWTMIDKITPRPSETVQKMLAEEGVEDMDIVITDKKTYIAPFVNAEGPQYLVIEDSFPAGRPPFEKAGVYMTDRETVNASERMKVTVCLNPLHTALAPYGCVLAYERFSDVMKDPEMKALSEQVGLQEGMKVVRDPGILSPKAFIEECINVRFPNEYVPDTPQRIAVDTSQMVAIRFGETIREYVNRFGSAKELVGIPLAIAGWLRYLLAKDVRGNDFELSPDPMNDELKEILKDIEIGRPETLKDQLKPLLANTNIFGIDLWEAGIGEKIEDIFREEIASYGAVREVLRKYLKNQ
ncbi:MAG: mannitol dehydrogenase family protein [Solobacterium sp.]|nr:mannitol dehydrogenase family protein [Solobacterium sp.]